MIGTVSDIGEIEIRHIDSSLSSSSHRTAEGGQGLPIVGELRPGRQLVGPSPTSFKVRRCHVGRLTGRYAHYRRVRGDRPDLFKVRDKFFILRHGTSFDTAMAGQEEDISVIGPTSATSQDEPVPEVYQQRTADSPPFLQPLLLGDVTRQAERGRHVQRASTLA